ncbi:hypothetical protein GQX74_009178 [Glossina fuscipes]|nr:hypothetical protein GQX74_009178 [Glossina fuscipes]
MFSEKKSYLKRKQQISALSSYKKLKRIEKKPIVEQNQTKFQLHDIRKLNFFIGLILNLFRITQKCLPHINIHIFTINAGFAIKLKIRNTVVEPLSGSTTVCRPLFVVALTLLDVALNPAVVLVVGGSN